MKVYRWSSVVEFFTRRMFVRDADGRTIFFPWGIRRKGYILRDPKRKSKIAGFYTGLIISYFSAIIVLGGFRHDFWLIVNVFVACSSLMLLTWYLYAWNITKSLSVAKQSYADIVLEKISTEASEYVETKADRDLVRKSYSPEPVKEDFLLPLKAFYYELSATQLAAISWIIMFIVGLIWYGFQPSIIKGQTESYLFFALLSFFAGLGFFFITSRAETSGFMEFIQWKLSYFILAAVCWGIAIYLMFKYLSGYS